MRLTRHTDYVLRVLMQVGLNEGELVRISDIAESFGISRNHLTKIVHQLGTRGYLETRQGRGGGIRLARAPSKIVIGDVVRDFEEDLDLVECFNPGRSECRIQSTCILRGALGDALAAFLDALDDTTLADLLEPRRRLRALLDIDEPPGARQPIAPALTA
ncbi:MAG TPA: Rrf2 family transcriptional regulator [Arenicellales bacterium]|nr:Rrf2 family transcriptional regulator [Arenicellales bacterium]